MEDKFITLKEMRNFAYAETTSDGYYKLTSVSEDGTCCTIKCVYHRKTDYINKEYQIPIDRITEDFIEADAKVVYGFLEADLINTHGWAIRLRRDPLKYREIKDNMYSYSCTSTNIWDSDIYRETRLPLYYPDAESASYPTPHIYVSNYYRDSIDRAMSTIYRDMDKAYDYLEAFFIVNDEIFDRVVSRTAENTYGFEIVDYPEELKMPLKSVTYKVAVFKKNDRFIYICNVKCDQLVFNSAIFFFDQIGKPLSEEAKQALLNRDKVKYYEDIFKDIEAIAAKIDEKKRLEMFNAFQSQFQGIIVGPLKSQLNAAQENYDNATKRVRDYMQQIQELRSRIFYLEHGVEDGESEFVDFIKDIKDNIVSIRVYGGSIELCIRTFLTYWDDDLWEIYRKSDSGFRSLSDTNKIMLDNIFKNRSLKLLIEQKFKLDFASQRAKKITSYEEDEGTRGIPNPHIHEYDCWGTHDPHIIENISNGNYIQAYSQCVACISGITLDDSAVMNRFIEYVASSYSCYNHRPCLYDVESGEYMTMNEYREKIKDMEWKEN